MSGFEVFGAWVGIALTLMILSFLYDDNPVYKVAEHLFLGVSIGVAVTEKYFGVLRRNLLDKIDDPFTGGPMLHLVYIIPLILSLLLFAKLSKQHGWLARIPIAILVAAYAGVKMTGEANGNLLRQVANSMPDLRHSWASNLHIGSETALAVTRHGSRVVETVVGTCTDAGPHWMQGLWCWSNDGAGVVSSLLLVTGLVCCLVYFIFSVEQNRPLRIMARIGVWFLMIGFGASFGFTVMGRIALAIGRGEELLGKNLTPEDASLVHPRSVSLLLTLAIVVVLALWRRRSSDDTKQLLG